MRTRRFLLLMSAASVAGLCGSAPLPVPRMPVPDTALSVIAAARCGPGAREQQALRRQLVSFRVPAPALSVKESIR